MITVTPAAEDRIDVTVDGPFDTTEMQRFIDTFEASTVGLKGGKMLAHVEGFGIPHGSSMGEQLKRLPDIVSAEDKIGRLAMVTDQDWLRQVGELEGADTPGFEVKAFRPNEMGDAEAWLSA